MVYILNASSAYPKNIIDTDYQGIKERRTVLPLDYIALDKNKDISQAKKVSITTPTDLAVESILKNISELNIAKEEIELLIGESSTPDQVTPGESHRVGAKLEHIGPAFDIASSGTAFTLFLDTLNSWREELVPNYAICFSTNTPTQYLDFNHDFSNIFGDAACSFLISKNKQKGFKVIETNYKSFPLEELEFNIPVNDYMSFNPRSLEKLKKLSIDLFTKSKLKTKGKTALIAPQLSIETIETFASDISLTNYNNYTNFSNTGNTLGSSGATVLADNWKEIFDNNDSLLLFQAGSGPSCGYVYCEKVE